MKFCQCCKTQKSILEFSRQKKNQTKFYAWCDACRFDPMAGYMVQRKNSAYHNEIEELRNKVRERLVLNKAQVVEVRKARESGERVADIAARYGVSKDVIYRASKGKGMYA